MHYSSKTGGFAPADFLLQIIGLKIDYNQLLVAKSELFEGCDSKNGEINVFLDCSLLIIIVPYRHSIGKCFGVFFHTLLCGLPADSI